MCQSKFKFFRRKRFRRFHSAESRRLHRIFKNPFASTYRIKKPAYHW